MTRSTPGRPQIGPAFVVRFPPDLLGRVDQAAADISTSRAGWLRAAAEDQLAYPRHNLAALAAWMVDEGLANDVGYALDRPDKYRTELYCALHEIDLATMDDLLAQREAVQQATNPTGLPHRWTYEQTSPVDFALRCPHGASLRNTQAERAGRAPATCRHGCNLSTLEQPRLEPPLERTQPTSSSPVPPR